jgi:hypothetical protein
MSDDIDKIDLSTNLLDRGVAVTKALAGLIPVAGSVIAELISNVIPNQRLDRVVQFAEALQHKLMQLDQQMVADRLRDPHYIDLVEDGMFQAARAISDDRKRHIASLVKNGISDDEANLEGHKHVLSLLGEINDSELLILCSYRYPSYTLEAQAFHKRHETVLTIEPAVLGVRQEVRDKNTIHRAYKEHLARLGLLVPKYKKSRKGELPEFDEKTGAIKAAGYQLTSLSRMLLQRIDELDSNETTFDEPSESAVDSVRESE